MHATVGYLNFDKCMPLAEDRFHGKNAGLANVWKKREGLSSVLGAPQEHDISVVPVVGTAIYVTIDFSYRLSSKPVSQRHLPEKGRFFFLFSGEQDGALSCQVLSVEDFSDSFGIVLHEPDPRWPNHEP